MFSSLTDILRKLVTEVVNLKNITNNNIIASVSTEITRPSNTTLYTAKDVIGTSPATYITFSNCASSTGGSGSIIQLTLETNDVAFTDSTIRLHIYSDTPTAIADNEPFVKLYADKGKYVGYVDFLMLEETTATGEAGFATKDNIVLDYICTDTSLYGILESIDGVTPASAQKFYIKMLVSKNLL